MQDDLFGSALPPGLAYAPGFLSPTDEAALLQWIGTLPLQEARYKAYTARRRVLGFGSRFDYDLNHLQPADPIPDTLLPLRERAAAWAGIDAATLANALVAEYRPGTPLGWHRDVPDYELVIGLSLGGEARMRLRRYPPVAPKKADVLSLDLAPRSIYLLRGEARWGWQHSIAPTPALRWSITFRTLRAERGQRERRAVPSSR
jgi:alkylated DNA repair dioxygenase AlkB